MTEFNYEKETKKLELANSNIQNIIDQYNVLLSNLSKR